MTHFHPKHAGLFCGACFGDVSLLVLCATHTYGLLLVEWYIDPLLRGWYFTLKGGWLHGTSSVFSVLCYQRRGSLPFAVASV